MLLCACVVQPRHDFASLHTELEHMAVLFDEARAARRRAAAVLAQTVRA
jgi:hypothetical protein